MAGFAITSAAPATASATLAPALARISAALSGARPDKWKGPDAARQDAAANMASISRDLDGTLPPLLAAADQAPGSVSALLPVYRNVDALYDVLLRVNETAGRGAPRDQADALASALSQLEAARHAFGDQLAQASAAQEQTLKGLQAKLAQAAAAPVPVCPPEHPAPAHKSTHRRHHVEHAAPAQTPQQ